MNRIDLHPEHLLDRLVSGELDSEGCAVLEAHTSICETCKAESLLSRGLSTTAAAMGDTAAKDEAQIAAVLAQLRRERSARRPALGKRTVGRAVAAAALLVAVGAAAATLAPRLWPKSASVIASGAAKPGKPSSAPAPDEPAAPLVMPAEPEEGRSPDRSRPRFEPKTGEKAAVPAADAATLLREATELRKAGKYAEARAKYSRLQHSFPASSEALVSRLAVGRLALKGNPAEALAQFQAYLDRRGPLRSEALVGKAKALAALGRSAEEQAIWRQIQQENPNSPYADQARRRLSQP